MIPRPSCFMFDRHVAARAFSRAWAKTGNRIAARIAMIAITTRSSISVNAGTRNRFDITQPPSATVDGFVSTEHARRTPAMVSTHHPIFTYYFAVLAGDSCADLAG